MAEPKGMQKLSGKRTGFGRNSGEPRGTEEAILCRSARENLSGNKTECAAGRTSSYYIPCGSALAKSKGGRLL